MRKQTIWMKNSEGKMIKSEEKSRPINYFYVPRGRFDPLGKHRTPEGQRYSLVPFRYKDIL